MTTKTEQALALVDQGVAPFAAARQVGMKSPGALYVAIKKRRATIVCPCCDSKVERLNVPDNVAQTIRDWIAKNRP